MDPLHRHASRHSAWLRAALAFATAVSIAGCAVSRPPAAAQPSSPAVVPSPQTSTVPAYNTSGYRPKPVAEQAMLYSGGSDVTLPDTEPHDATGVRMYRADGRLYDHPVAQAQYGLGLLATYQRHHDPVLLELALKQARRVIAHRTVVNGAWFYPYPFSFALHGDPKQLVRAPWYSARPTVQRQRILGHGVWLKIADGPFKDWWVKEKAGQVWLGGVSAAVTYRPARSIAVDGTVTGYLLDPAGRATGTRTVRLVHSTLPVDQTADVNGRESWHVTAGALAGTWSRPAPADHTPL